MKKLLLISSFFVSLSSYDFGIKINEFNSSEVDSYFNYEYGKSRPYTCNLRSSFLPNTKKGEIFKKMFGNKKAYKSLRSLACNIDENNYFLWLIFKDDILKQIKYELNKNYEDLKQELLFKYELIKENKVNLDDYYISDYDEFEIGINTKCNAKYCRDFSIFKISDEIELVLINANFNNIKKSSIIIRAKDLKELYDKNKF